MPVKTEPVIVVTVEFVETRGFRTDVTIDRMSFDRWSADQVWSYPADEPYRLRKYLDAEVPYHRMGVVTHLDIDREIDSVQVVA